MDLQLRRLAISDMHRDTRSDGPQRHAPWVVEPAVSTTGWLAVVLGTCLVLGACSADTSDPGSRSATNADSGASTTPGNPGGSGLLVVAAGSGATTGTTNAASRLPGGAAACATGMQNTSPVTPTVWLVIDGSSSMNSGFEGGTSRWAALRSTLMDPAGVVDTLQPFVRFGMVIYAGGDGATCPRLVVVDPALNNLSTMDAQYPMTPLAQGTPTDKALEYVVNNLPVLNAGVLDENTGPVYVVLATDGSPNDNCGGNSGGGRGQQGNVNTEQRVVDITAEGTANGTQMFVISLAGGDSRLSSHLDMVAAATASQTPPFVPATQADLITAFQEIVGGASCLVSLDGSVESGSECAGTVQLNSVELPCNQDDGWSLFNRSTVQLKGDACDMFLAHQSMVIASFPCEVFSPN